MRVFSARDNSKSAVKVCVLALLFLFFAIVVINREMVFAADNGLPDGYEPDIYNAIPAQQFKDVFETETIEISGIRVIPDHPINTFTETIHFRIFNSTTQETEYEVDTINDGIGNHTLPAMQLKKNHNYIFFVEDPYFMLGTKKYVQILDADADMAKDGAGAYDYKYIVNRDGEEIYNEEYQKLTSIRVFKRDDVSENPREDARCCIGCTRIPVVVTYKGQPVTEKLKFRFVSDIETRQGMTNYKDETAGQGILYANLIEDVTYMVYLDSDKYVMEPFPIVVKDKSEYGEGRYAYNHTTCVRVDAEHPVKLYDSIDEAHNDSDLGMPVLSVTSLKGRVTVTGMNFRHLLILDRVLDKSTVSGLAGKDYEVFDVTAVNPHRWEISKLVGTKFSITKKVPHNKLVTNIYYVDDNGQLNSLSFTQKSADEVSFSTNSLSLYPLVVVYHSSKTYDQQKAEEKAAQEAEKRKEKEAAWKGVRDKSMPAVKIRKVKSAKKKATVNWKKLTKKQLKKAGKAKIEIQYSLNKKFPMEKTSSKYVGKKKASAGISKLKSKKYYYFRIRTVKNSGGVKRVSSWSKIRKIKIK